MHTYSNPARESDPHALPDVEIFHVAANRKLRPDFDYNCQCGFYVCLGCDKPWYPMEIDDSSVIYDDSPGCPDCDSIVVVGEGYYWQSCFPGCLPDGEPNGPFKTADEAKADAQSSSEE